MVTLLFAVFVVLYAIQIAGHKDEQKVAGSMQESFNTPLPDIPIDRRVGPEEQGIGIFDHFKGQSIKPSLIQKYPSSDVKIKTIDDEMNKVKLKLEERLYGKNKFRDNTKPGQERVVSVSRTGKGFKLQLLARHFFEPGSVNVTRGALAELDQVAGILKELGRPVVIEGHTDSIPAPGELGNWEISALRATNVLKYFIRKHNFPASTLAAAGYADTRPIASNGTESGRMLNRRIEIHVDYDNETAGEP
jgi:chemotaxis protein MotB